MCTHQHFTCAGLFVLQEVEKCSAERCRSLSRSPGSCVVHTEYDTKLPFVFSLQRRASEKRNYSFDEEKALYSLVHAKVLCLDAHDSVTQRSLVLFPFFCVILWTWICFQWAWICLQWFWPKPCGNALDYLSFFLYK